MGVSLKASEVVADILVLQQHRLITPASNGCIALQNTKWKSPAGYNGGAYEINSAVNY
jgi:hypothetical protein